MAKKFTIDDVRKYLEENDKEHLCTLLSEEYINISTPLTFRCNKCGKIFERDFSHIKRNRFQCSDCSGHPQSNTPKRKITIDTIREYIAENDKEHNCTLLSDTYVNNKTPLLFRCNCCGKTFQRSAAHLFRGRFRCETCGELAGAKKLTYTREDVEADISKKGYKLIGEYKNAHTPVLASCKRGHTFNLVYSQYRKGCSGCAQCAVIEHSGENHWNWQGGISTISDYLRTCINPWKQSCLKAANYTCDISGKKDDLVVHHFENFSDIVREAFETLRIELKPTISDYSDEDRKKLADYVLSKHNLSLGVVLNKEIHDLFHKIYGKTNNTREQYLIFKEDYLKGKYSDTQPS